MQLKKCTIEEINSLNKSTLMEVLGIECVEIGEDYIISTMPVDERTRQPMGLLHGGASAALIESVGSMGSQLLMDVSKEYSVGLEINANHIGSVRSGKVKAVGRIIHAGKRTHLWQVDIFDMETEKLVCTGRLTCMVIQRS
jgi:1,4-dihydroxy-2-naphthoyl-CoA hydrolase